MSKDKPAEKKGGGGEVVYRRANAPDDAAQGEAHGDTPRADKTRAPILSLLVVGFALLLALVLALGLLSVRRVESVSERVLDLERQQGTQLSVLLQLRGAATKLNNEVRARADAEARGGLLPPVAQRLNNARAEFNKVLPIFDHLPIAQTEKGAIFHRDLNAYLETVADFNRYSLEGFEKFRVVDVELQEFLDEAARDQDKVLQESDALQSRAAQTIRWLTWLALLVGALVAAITIREVQRRFRQVRESLEIAGRERSFSTQMLEGIVSAVAAIDARGSVRSANTAFFKLVPQAVIGGNVHDKLASPEAQEMLEAATAKRVEQPTYHGRWTLNAAALQESQHAAKRFFDVYSSPLVIDDERGQIIMLVDVTEAAEAEHDLRRSESLAAVGQAAAQLAHEIKNPLGSIRLGVSMLRDATTDQNSIKTIDLVNRGIHHLNNLVGEVTLFSREKTLALSKVELHGLLDGSLELVADRLGEKRTPVEKRWSKEPLRGEWDEDKLRQVFVNLIANAVDASKAESPIVIATERIAVNASDGKENAGNGAGDNKMRQGSHTAFARVSVQDHGSGMNEATRARIFEPFFTTKTRGTGLGLAIVKQIVEQHGGTINVTSEPGKGTRFVVDLPLKDRDR
ncbi:MAG: nitrogen regulation protein NR(II) [Pyrinomonadaceae bacterium]